MADGKSVLKTMAITEYIVLIEKEKKKHRDNTKKLYIETEKNKIEQYEASSHITKQYRSLHDIPAHNCKYTYR